MIILKTDSEIDILREGGHILSGVLSHLMKVAKPGMTTGELDAIAEKMMRDAGGEPSFKGYKVHGAPPFSSAICACLDDEVVHAPADPNRKIQDGQLLKLDLGLRYKGLCTDMAGTVAVGKVDEKLRELSRVTREALLIGIEKAKEGNWISDIGKAVDKHVRRHGYTTVKDLVGHGVGKKVHEDPPVPNYHDRSLEPVKISRGLVIAIEPMVNVGAEDVYTKDDDWTIATSDESHSAHWEATIAITAQGTEILTPIPEIE